jgi:hypothetical protein
MPLSDAAARDALRTRLQELRTTALQQLTEAAPVIDCGLLRIIADVGATLVALEDEAGDAKL